MDKQEMEDKLKAGRKSGLGKEGMKALALELSITKWEHLVKDPRGSPCGSVNCALCEFYSKPADWCEGCPVRVKTGMPDCEGTAFILFWDLAQEGASDEELSKVAQQEVDFLKSLREEVE